MIPLQHTLTACFFLLVLTSRAQPPVRRLTLAHTLQSDMVVQQLHPLELWGRAPAGSALVLSAGWLTMPAVAVRYAFINYPVTNFQNKDGWPAEPFRSDHW